MLPYAQFNLGDTTLFVTPHLMDLVLATNQNAGASPLVEKRGRRDGKARMTAPAPNVSVRRGVRLLETDDVSLRTLQPVNEGGPLRLIVETIDVERDYPERRHT